MNTIHNLAAEFAAAFTSGQREDANRDTIRILKDGSPEWMSDTVRAAHDGGNMLPDDWRYRWIEEAADAIEEAGEDADLDDVREQFVDAVDVYNGRLLNWIGSSLLRAEYVEDGVRDYGWPRDGGFFKALQIGQLQERAEVFDQVRAALEARAEEMADA